MYIDIRLKQIPLKMIAFISDEDVLQELSFMAISNYFYKSKLENINEYCVNSFNFTSSIDEFYKIVNTVDYGKCDVSVTIISNCESKGFTEVYPDVLPMIEHINELLIDRVCNLRFIKMAKSLYDNVKHIFIPMYKYNFMHSIKRLL